MNMPTIPDATTSTACEDVVPPSLVNTATSQTPLDESSSVDDDDSSDGEDLYVAIVRTLLDGAEMYLASTPLENITDPKEAEGRAVLKTIVNTVDGIISRPPVITHDKDSIYTDMEAASDEQLTSGTGPIANSCRVFVTSYSSSTVSTAERESRDKDISSYMSSSTACEMQGDSPAALNPTDNSQTYSGNTAKMDTSCEIHQVCPATDISHEKEGSTPEIGEWGTRTPFGDMDIANKCKEEPTKPPISSGANELELD